MRVSAPSLVTVAFRGVRARMKNPAAARRARPMRVAIELLVLSALGGTDDPIICSSSCSVPSLVLRSGPRVNHNPSSSSRVSGALGRTTGSKGARSSSRLVEREVEVRVELVHLGHVHGEPRLHRARRTIHRLKRQVSQWQKWCRIWRGRGRDDCE